ncbi:GtrA family protein [Halomonas sp. PA5]|nr:GtrA family protein [Halomonas populi]QJQ97152.1 GtrA family protein [Halomonas sp. PA5]
MAGVVGFLIDTGVLYLLKGTLGIYGARVPSFFAAVFVTWWLNRCLAFGRRRSGIAIWREFLHYLGLMLGGGVVNYVVYSLLVASVETVHQFPILGVAAGSVAGMAVNYLSSRYVLFRNVH